MHLSPALPTSAGSTWALLLARLLLSRGMKLCIILYPGPGAAGAVDLRGKIMRQPPHWHGAVQVDFEQPCGSSNRGKGLLEGSCLLLSLIT